MSLNISFREWANNYYTSHTYSALCQLGLIGENADRLFSIAKQHEVANDWTALYKLTTLPDEAIAQLDGPISRKSFGQLSKPVEPIDPPTGQFSCVVIDPPWPMEKIEREVRPNQIGFDYPTMSEAEIMSLDIPAADDCHLWLWTTQKFMPIAFDCLDAWGARYVCTFVWHKPGGFQPVGLPQYNGEFVLYARIGSPKFVDTKAFPTVFQADRGAHSEKPSEFYEMIQRVTDDPRIDMFARRRIEGFTPWGNEIGG